MPLKVGTLTAVDAVAGSVPGTRTKPIVVLIVTGVRLATGLPSSSRTVTVMTPSLTPSADTLDGRLMLTVPLKLNAALAFCPVKLPGSLGEVGLRRLQPTTTSATNNVATRELPRRNSRALRPFLLVMGRVNMGGHLTGSNRRS